MNIEEQLAELLARLGVELEVSDRPRRDGDESGAAGVQMNEVEDEDEDERATSGGAGVCPLPLRAPEHNQLIAMPDMSLFQTSREHYGVFYRLDLVDGMPQLRVFLPEDAGALKMRCYVICAGEVSPLRDWFESASLYEGSPAFDDARDNARQHLLFAAGELMKKLFWSGEMSTMRFPDEIEVLRVA